MVKVEGIIKNIDTDLKTIKIGPNEYNYNAPYISGTSGKSVTAMWMIENKYKGMQFKEGDDVIIIFDMIGDINVLKSIKLTSEANEEKQNYKPNQNFKPNYNAPKKEDHTNLIVAACFVGGKGLTSWDDFRDAIVDTLKYKGAEIDKMKEFK